MQMWRVAVALSIILPAAFAVPIDLTFAVPAVVIIVAAGLGLASMLGKSLSNPQLDAWAKTEVRELFAGMILIAICIGLFVASNGLAVALTGNANYVDTAQSVLQKWGDSISNAYHYVIKAATAIKIAASYSSGANAPIWWVSINYQTGPLSGAGIFLVPLNIATQALTNGLYLSEGLSMLVRFLSVVVPKILLPLAFCARIIPFTRRTGNTLIALSIAGLILLPYSILMADFFNTQIGMPNPTISDLSVLDADPYPILAFAPICEFQALRFMFSLTDFGFAAVACLPLLFIPVYGWALYGPCYAYTSEVIYPIISMVSQILGGLALIAWESKMALQTNSYGAQVFDQLQPFLAAVNNLLLVIYLDMIFIALITITGARSISSALGGEAYMAGIQRLI